MEKVFRSYHSLITICIALIAQLSYADDLLLNGRAIADKFQTDYFLAELYTNQTSSDEASLSSNKNIRMQMTILVDQWSQRQVTQHWNQSIFINNPDSVRTKYREDLGKLLGTIGGPLLRGDNLVFNKDAQTFTFSINGVTLFKTRNTGLANLFLNTWIGARPPSSDFKVAILGKGDQFREQLSAATNIELTKGRKKAIEDWLKPAKVEEATESQELAGLRTVTSTDVNSELQDDTERKDVSAKATASSTTTTSATSIASTFPPKADTDNRTEKIEPEQLSQETSQPVAENPTNANKANSAPKLTKATMAQSTTAAAITDESLTRSQVEPTYTPTSDIALKDTANTTGATLDLPEDEPNTRKANQQSLFKAYRSNILTLTYQNLIYPGSAIDRQQEGKILVKLTLDRRGHVRDIKYDQKSRYSVLNQAVVDAIQKASPYPKPPKKLRGREVIVDVPIVFNLSS